MYGNRKAGNGRPLQQLSRAAPSMNSKPKRIHVLGGGPAGSAAAIAALSETPSVDIFEESTFPRHKVCGEFLSSEIAPLLEALGLWQEFSLLRPARITRMILHFGTRVSRSRLPEGAFGLSRYELDRLLFNKALREGARASRLRKTPEDSAPEDAAENIFAKVLAIGRRSKSSKGSRLFGFKAHFKGPLDDAVELFFFRGGYVGVSAIENGFTNICGIAPEHVLGTYEFHIEDLITACPALADRLCPLTRISRWFWVGPLVLGEQPHRFPPHNFYLAGDSLGFIDPFTGLGLVTAIGTGIRAGLAAARGSSVDEHLADCHRILRRPKYLAGILRAALTAGLAEKLGPLIPGRCLFRITRPAFLISKPINGPTSCG
jgi:hypothetical protein